MRLPAKRYYKNGQRFFFGVVIGAMISWLIFLFMFGHMQEEQAKTIRKQKEQILELQKEKNIWQEDFKKLNEKNKQLLTVQEVIVKIENAKKYRIDPLSVFEVEESIKEDINNLLAKDLHLVYESRDLLKKVIMNKQIKINDKRYRLIIKEMVIYTTLTIHLELILDD
ncbi:sporulation membrane protein YtrI [Fervidibacillus halotolerans]|uniref:Sporulation protein n=1 Tax=Fervidibacillus halotolerans TaxID=2980027 RepID=A0A9E8RZI4_9BACI|nr:sporulation membrane protein YtrI [Fervidibacillus halotolerans]WAA11672.1 sporulation protein [Fervidibacillus halotolerans]